MSHLCAVWQAAMNCLLALTLVAWIWLCVNFVGLAFSARACNVEDDPPVTQATAAPQAVVQVMAQPSVVMTQPVAAPMNMISVQVPPGAAPGMSISTQTPSGQPITVQVPQGAAPGSIFQVQVAAAPTQPAAQPTPTVEVELVQQVPSNPTSL